MPRRRLLLATLLGGAGPAPAADAWPRGLPAGPMQIVVPVEPGGSIDAMARLLAQHWAAEHRLTVSVLNRSGASGNVGTAGVARSRPDGQTLLLTGLSHLTSPMLHANAGYDAIDDFAPVARLGLTRLVLLVGDALKGMSLRELIEDPRSQRQGLAYGSAGFGHSSHLLAQVFMARTGARWLHVPYKGNGPALRALMAGEVQLQFLSLPAAPAALASGRVHAVAVVAPARLPVLPQVPTLAELGVAETEFQQWYGLLAPKGTPRETVLALSDLVVQASAHPGWVAQLQKLGADPEVLDAEAFARFLKLEQRRLDTLLRGIAVERAVS